MKKRMTKRMNESIDSLDRVVKGELGASAHLDTVEADAYNEEQKIDKKVNEIKDDLKKKGDAISTKSPDAPKVKTQNTYTKTYKLDESVEDFAIGTMSLDDFSDEDDYDAYLDFDMFDFIHKLCVFDEGKNMTANPLAGEKKKYNRFAAHGEEESSRIVVDKDGNIVLGAETAAYFNDIMRILDTYKIDYEGPTATRNSDYPFHLLIHVPMMAPNYPMLVADYFEDMGLDIEDAMYDKKWKARYTNAIDKINKENERELAKRQRERRADAPRNDSRVKTLFDKAVTLAYQQGDISIEDHLKNLYATLDAEGLRYSKTTVKKNFMDAVQDEDFDDED